MCGGGASSGRSEQRFEVKKFPGLFEEEESPVGQSIGFQLLDVLASEGRNEFGLDVPEFDIPEEFGGGKIGDESSTLTKLERLPREESATFGALEDRLLNPQPLNLTGSEQAVIDDIIRQTQGDSAIRGLQPSATSIGQAIAPSLIDFRNQRTADLLGASELDLGALTTQRGQDVDTEIAQRDVQLQNRKLLIDNLVELARLSLPELLGGNVGSSRTSSTQFSLF